MKKFLSIKNTQGIYVARASFSSDETVIDFVNSKHSESSITNPVSIVVTPNQLASTSTLTTSNSASTCDSISVQTQLKSSGKKKFKARLLKFLHIKRKAKMADDATQERSDQQSAASGSYPMLPTPKMSRAKVSKSRTAELVKKFTLTPKKSPPPPPQSPQVLNRKKSLIPLRTATSVEALSNAPQSVQKNRVETRAAVNHHSISEMNLVNIDYRQESGGDNSEVGFGVDDQTRYYANWSGNKKKRHMGVRSDNNNDEGIESNNSSSNSKMVSGRKSTSTEKLQITISGKKRITNTMDVATHIQPRSNYQLSDIESKRIERKPLTMQQPPRKLNINHDLTLMNTIGVPPAQTTQAPLAIPTAYRTATTTASMKKVIQSRTAIKAQSTMQSQQSVDASASAVNVERIKYAPKRADTLVTVTSFDVEDPDDIIAASERKLSSAGKKTTSLLTEIIEAERRNSETMDSERGYRFPNAATTENTEFSHQPSTSKSETIDQKAKQSGPEIIPKVVIEEVTSSPIESSVKTVKREKSKKLENSEKMENTEQASEKRFDLDIDKDSESTSASVHAEDIDMAPEVHDEDNELSTTSQPSQPPLQFEVGKQVRPIFPSNHNLHLNIYSALDNSSATTFSSILTPNSFVEMHNNELFSNLHFEPMSAPIMSANENEPLNVDGHKLNRIRGQKQSGRRRIAYLESASKQARTPSTPNQTIDMENNDMFTYENRLDSTLSQFSNLRTQSSAVITDRLMPPYGDLVWDDDGVNEPNAIVLVIYL